MQIVTVTFFRFENFADKWWAFGQMGIRPFKAGQTKDLTFARTPTIYQQNFQSEKR